jgi:hypothetical protein
MSDIDYLSAWFYGDGADAIETAEIRVGVILDAWQEVALVRAARGLPQYPGWEDLSPAAIARKVIGYLLDAGWKPPSAEEIAAAVEKHGTRQ